MAFQNAAKPATAETVNGLREDDRSGGLIEKTDSAAHTVVQADHIPVTLNPKCYVFVCFGCDLLAISERSDALTCSTACRVRAHRTGRLKEVRSIAETWRTSPAVMAMHGH
jgi:hypothetical protein